MATVWAISCCLFREEGIRGASGQLRLEAALEQLLLRFLAPYVDGVTRDNLDLGFFQGSMELKDLLVKPDALGLFDAELKLVAAVIKRQTSVRLLLRHRWLVQVGS